MAPLLNHACGTPSNAALITQGDTTTSAHARRVQVVVHGPGVSIDGTLVGVGEYVFGDLTQRPLGYELVIVGGAADVTVIQED